MKPLLSDILRRKKLYLLEMDGTIYLGDRLFPVTPPFLNALCTAGARYLFLTNNSSRAARPFAWLESRQPSPLAGDGYFNV